MIIYGLDPGTTQSALVGFDGKQAIDPLIASNQDMHWAIQQIDGMLAYEMVACYGMPVGAETFETVFWLGRLVERYRDSPGFVQRIRIYRKDVKLHLCNSMRAKDANVSQALIDRFGGTRQKAVGTKKQPGQLYGVKSHIWSALAVAVTAWDQMKTEAQ